MKTRKQYFSIGARPGEIPELDGLRGIAIILVLLRHAVEPTYREYGTLVAVGNWDLAIPLLNGWMGVDLFFVLSGFLITHHLLKRWPDEWSTNFALRYWGKRVLRTFPLYYAVVLLALFGVVPLFRPEVTDVGYSMFVHFAFLQDYLGSDLVVAFWSLGVEEKFYIVCPFVLYLLRNQQGARRVVVLVALAFLPLALRVARTLTLGEHLLGYESFFWVVRSPFHLAMDGLWVGTACALLLNARTLSNDSRSRAATIGFWISSLTLLACLLPVAWFDHGHYLASAIVLNIVAISFGGLLLSVCLGKTPIDRFLRVRWLRIIAVLSYSIYLIHLMLAPLAGALSSALLPAGSHSPWVQFLAFLPVFVGLSVAVAMVLHFIVEKPFLLLKDRIRL